MEQCVAEEAREAAREAAGAARVGRLREVPAVIVYVRTVVIVNRTNGACPVFR